jgi:predicted nuclease of restriction endonuclease-like (RecB) superfamily
MRPGLVPKLAAPGARLLADLRGMIAAARAQAARSVNAALVMLYWRLGQRIRRDILRQKRAAYGEQIIATLARRLTAEFGRGFSRRNLFSMLRFAELFPDIEIVQALTAQLGWTHFTVLLAMDDPLKRDFYAEMCRVERWSTRALEAKIRSMLFERTALSRKPVELIEKDLAALRKDDKVTPDLVFKDPYVLDFLGLRDTYSEKDLEAAILRDVERFLLELGAGFAFVERQKRIVIDGDDFYLDLRLFHRRLRRLVLVELKLGAFRAADFGQTTLYLRWLDRHERQPGEEPPIGLILCAGKADERIELLELESSGIRVAEYLTELPPREVLARRLHEAMVHARVRFGANARKPRP